MLWIELPRKIDTDELLKRALKQGICFAPGAVFSATGDFRHCFRVSCGHGWSDRIERAISQLAELAYQRLS